MSLARFSSSTPQYRNFTIARVVRARGWTINPSSSRTREEARGLEGFGDPCFSDRFACRHVRDGRSKSLAPSPGVEPVNTASFGGSSLKSVRTKVLVSSAGIEPATTDFVDQSLDNHQDEEMRVSLSRRKKEDSNPTHLPACPLFSKQVWLHSQFFFRGSGQCGNRTRYAELFRLPLYQLSLPTKIIFVCRGRQRTRTSRAVHGARIAFQAISVASRICLPKRNPEAARPLARSASRRRRARGQVARPRGEARSREARMRGRKPQKIEGHFCVMAQDAGARSLLPSVRPRAATQRTAATDPGGLPHRGEPAASPGETWA